MQAIETVTVGSGGAASIEFMAIGDIPATFTDLKIVVSLRSDYSGGDEGALIGFNGSTSNLSYRRLYAVPSVGSSSGSTGLFGLTPANSVTANTFSSAEIYIPNYRSSANKSYSATNVTENNGSTAFIDLVAGLWSQTAAITSIKLSLDRGGNKFVEHSTATLYGILAGSDGTTTVT